MVELDVQIGKLPSERHEEIKMVEQKKLTVSSTHVNNVLAYAPPVLYTINI